MDRTLALSAAALFALSVPAGKLLLARLSPAWLSALCYLGSGLGLLCWRALRGTAGEALPDRRDLPWLAASAAAGGVLAPLALFSGLALTAASSASMLLNFELAFTALIAVLFFGEQGGRRLWAAAALVTAGGMLLSWNGGGPGLDRGSLLVLAASLLWAADNNFTARISIKDPVTLGAVKGLAGGMVNAALALYAGGGLPAAGLAAPALLLGALCYGASLALFIRAMRGLGASRAGAFFGAYPFLGAAFGVLFLGEPLTAGLAAAGALMAGAFLLLSSERHAHRHRHEALVHDHPHTHCDGHHGHAHFPSVQGEHSHPHSHEALEHEHPHMPDAHHRHAH